MFTAAELKQQLNIDDIIKVVADLGGEPVSENSECIIYMTGDHHLNWEDGSPKLYLYKQTKSFYSYTASASYDIIGLVQARWDLEGLSYVFCDVLKYIAGVVGISKESFCPKGITSQPTWKKLVQRYAKPYTPTYQGKIYPKDELNLCLPYYHPMFLNDNISIKTMELFQIGWYPPQAQITIPVFSDSGELLGIHCRNTKEDVLAKGYKYLPLKTCSTHYKFKSSEVLYGVNVNKPWIEDSKQVLLFESPKSVLQTHGMGIHNSLALFGMNCSKHQRDILVSYGVNEVVVCLDRQYHDVGDEEWTKYQKCVEKIARLFKGYAKVTSVTDVGRLLDYKESPSDGGLKIFNELYNKRYEVIV